MESSVIPETPAGRRVREWLDCLESGELDRLRNFAARHFSESALAESSPEERAERDRYLLYRDTRGLTPAQVERSSETELGLLARAQLSGEWLHVHVTVGGEPPHLIERLGVSFVQPFQAPAPESPPSEAELVAELRSFVDSLAQGDCFSGAVLLAHGDEVLLERAYGLANEASAVPNRRETRFNLDSLGEMFTAVAIGQLAERGRLDFGDKLSVHLPDYPGAVAERITIHQLLTHTSGLGHFQSERFRARRETLRAVSDFVALFAEEPLIFEPGERFGYSTAGYVVLGALIGQVSGQDYFGYVREHIFAPAGMADTDFDDYERPGVATGYTRHGADGQLHPAGPLRSNLELLPAKGGPAGGCVSTLRDLNRFGRALLRHKLLSRELTELLVAGKVVWSPVTSYGYGFEERRFAGSVGHGGGAPGASTDFAVPGARLHRCRPVELRSAGRPPGRRLRTEADRRAWASGGGREAPWALAGRIVSASKGDRRPDPKSRREGDVTSARRARLARAEL